MCLKDDFDSVNVLHETSAQCRHTHKHYQAKNKQTRNVIYVHPLFFFAMLTIGQAEFVLPPLENLIKKKSESVSKRWFLINLRDLIFRGKPLLDFRLYFALRRLGFKKDVRCKTSCSLRGDKTLCRIAQQCRVPHVTLKRGRASLQKVDLSAGPRNKTDARFGGGSKSSGPVAPGYASMSA